MLRRTNTDVRNELPECLVTRVPVGGACDSGVRSVVHCDLEPAGSDDAGSSANAADLDALTVAEKSGRLKFGTLNENASDVSRLWPDESGGQRLLDLLDGISSQGGKAIIFVHHVHLREQLFRGIGRWFSLLHGGGAAGSAEADKRLQMIGGETAEEERLEVVRKFSDATDVQVLVLATKCAAVGLNLQAAQTIIFAEIPLSVGEFDQCVARAVRQGQRQE